MSVSLIPAASGFIPNGIKIRTSAAVCALARRLWPINAAKQLAVRADVSTRAAGLWLEDRTNIGADSLVELLRSDIGFELLTELMSDQRPPWWDDFQRIVRLAEIDREQRSLAERRAALFAQEKSR